jgi:putative transposase
MIDRNDELSISRQAKLLGISRGSVYYQSQGVSEAELSLMRHIDELHLEHPFMGSRQLTRQLRRQGFEVGRLHVRTLMLRMGIQAMAPQPGSSKPAPGHKVYPYLLRNLVVDRPNQVWALDTTYIPMRQGFVYLTAIVDVATGFRQAAYCPSDLPCTIYRRIGCSASFGIDRRDGGRQQTQSLHPERIVACI